MSVFCGHSSPLAGSLRPGALALFGQGGGAARHIGGPDFRGRSVVDFTRATHGIDQVGRLLSSNPPPHSSGHGVGGGGVTAGYLREPVVASLAATDGASNGAGYNEAPPAINELVPDGPLPRYFNDYNWFWALRKPHEGDRCGLRVRPLQSQPDAFQALSPVLPLWPFYSIALLCPQFLGFGALNPAERALSWRAVENRSSEVWKWWPSPPRLSQR